MEKFVTKQHCIRGVNTKTPESFHILKRGTSQPTGYPLYLCR